MTDHNEVHMFIGVRLFHDGKLLWGAKNVIRYLGGKIMYSAFTPGEMKLDVFMKWLRYAEDCPPTTLWYLPSGRNLNDGELREIKTNTDIEAMISELGSTTNLQLYADGPIEEFYFMNPLNHRKPPVGSMKLQTCSEYVADGVEILTQEDVAGDEFFSHVDDCEPEKETDGPGKNIYDTIDDDDPTYNVVDFDYESEDLKLVREDAENDLESEPISKTVTMFKDVKDIKDVKFSIRLTFINKVQAVDAIRDYAVAGGYKIKFKKNDRKRVRAKCGDGCNWEILISKVGRDIYWQVKTLISRHTCSRSITNSNASKKWLVKHMTPVLMRDYSMGTIKVVEYVKHNLYVEITKNMAWRTRVACFDAIHGDYKQQYARIRDYGVEIKRSNPGTSGLNLLFKQWGVEHRFCVRHLYANFRVDFPSKELRLLMWYASKAPNIDTWKRVMEDIKAVNLKAYELLIGP
ncbi:hypothetical protein ACFE04_018652 [Oxalis oulophora]